MRILLVEDDTMIGDAVRAGLRKQGIAVDWIEDGVAAKAALTTENFDLVLLDLGLPKLDGLQV
ncbi:MAG: response regulator, partial [Gammaproteobacteria bacterium]|nr:response regulator [Gammaproteobacteria bacterium]